MFEDIGNIVNAIGNLIIQMCVCVYLVYIQKGKNSEIIVYSYYLRHCTPYSGNLAMLFVYTLFQRQLWELPYCIILYCTLTLDD